MCNKNVILENLKLIMQWVTIQHVSLLLKYNYVNLPTLYITLSINIKHNNY